VPYVTNSLPFISAQKMIRVSWQAPALLTVDSGLLLGIAI
jgi:hypothetical protein